MDAVVLAGGQERGQLYSETGIAYRPLLLVAGRTILSRTLEALAACEAVSRVALVAPDAVLAAAPPGGVDIGVPAGHDFVANLLAGVDAVQSERLLIVTGDLPLLTAPAVSDLVAQAEEVGAEVVYPIIPKGVCEARFPGGRRTYVRLREGVFTGGNATVLSRAFADRSRQLLTSLYESRKSPLKLASLFGAGFLLGLATGRLTLARLTARASAIAGGSVAAVVSQYPELGFDVDKIEDLRSAERAAVSTR